jgi:hypothetical protein
LSVEDIVVLSDHKTIQQEVRFWIAGNDIVAYAPYGHEHENNEGYDAELTENLKDWMMRHLSDIYKPDDVFVVDAAVYEDDALLRHGIVEYNSFNASGFYEAPHMKELIMAVESKAWKAYADIWGIA